MLLHRVHINQLNTETLLRRLEAANVESDWD